MAPTLALHIFAAASRRGYAFRAKYRPFVPADTPIHFASASLRVGFVSISSTTLWGGAESRHTKQEVAQWGAAGTGSRPRRSRANRVPPSLPSSGAGTHGKDH